jgi:hypothetical protein
MSDSSWIDRLALGLAYWGFEYSDVRRDSKYH